MPESVEYTRFILGALLILFCVYLSSKLARRPDGANGNLWHFMSWFFALIFIACGLFNSYEQIQYNRYGVKTLGAVNGNFKKVCPGVTRASNIREACHYDADVVFIDNRGKRQTFRHSFLESQMRKLTPDKRSITLIYNSKTLYDFKIIVPLFDKNQILPDFGIGFSFLGFALFLKDRRDNKKDA